MDFKTSMSAALVGGFLTGYLIVRVYAWALSKFGEFEQ